MQWWSWMSFGVGMIAGALVTAAWFVWLVMTMGREEFGPAPPPPTTPRNRMTRQEWAEFAIVCGMILRAIMIIVLPYTLPPLVVISLIYWLWWT